MSELEQRKVFGHWLTKGIRCLVAAAFVVGILVAGAGCGGAKSGTSDTGASSTSTKAEGS